MDKAQVSTKARLTDKKLAGVWSTKSWRRLTDTKAQSEAIVCLCSPVLAVRSFCKSFQIVVGIEHYIFDKKSADG